MHSKNTGSVVSDLALIITTYNSPEKLSLVLRSVLAQSKLPAEVIIADDGSGPQTGEEVIHFAEKAESRGIKVRHVWQEDKGFRAAAIRNRATKETVSPYLVFIDGDIILHQRFIADHIRHKTKGKYVLQSRCFLTEQLTTELQTGRKNGFNLFTKGIRHKIHGVRIPVLTRLFYSYGSKGLKHVRSFVFGIYKEDLIKVNGFD